MGTCTCQAAWGSALQGAGLAPNWAGREAWVELPQSRVPHHSSAPHGLRGSNPGSPQGRAWTRAQSSNLFLRTQKE